MYMYVCVVHTIILGPDTDIMSLINSIGLPMALEDFIIFIPVNCNGKTWKCDACIMNAKECQDR